MSLVIKPQFSIELSVFCLCRGASLVGREASGGRDRGERVI